MIYFLIQLPYDHDHDSPSTIWSLDEENKGVLTYQYFVALPISKESVPQFYLQI